MQEDSIIGKKINEIYETKPTYGNHLFGEKFKSAFFSIIIELEDKVKFELGIHEIRLWNSNQKLICSKGTFWANENKFEYKQKKIVEIIHRNINEYYDGSLKLVLENGVTLEHLSTNGDELYINTIKNSNE